ncbi:MAG: response regulator [Myxococcales bacterium]|nr:response regulator [Myxococcales bacterium]MCB9731635.1 response regulator [Deltaproteobacteria bacterium]
MTGAPTIILLADDERHIRTLVRMTLGDVQNAIVEATDGAAAVELAERTTPALIIIDQMMPRMNGRDAVARMRAMPHLARVPIIMLTANDDAASEAQARVAGVDSYLLKPFSPLELLATVDGYLGAAREEAS